MTKLFSFSDWRGASLPLAAAACLAFALGATPAAADQCAKGQFFRKSKKTCIDKAEAAKLGIYHGLIPKAPEQPAETAPPPVEAAAAVPSPPPETPALPPPPSPYGELVLEQFTTDR